MDSESQTHRKTDARGQPKYLMSSAPNTTKAQKKLKQKHVSKGDSSSQWGEVATSHAF